MPEISHIRCEVCGGSGRVTVAPQRRLRTADDVKRIPRAQVRSVPPSYRSGRLDLFALATKRERLEKDLRNAHRQIKLAVEQIAEITREMQLIQGRIDKDEERGASAEG